jgi:predicted naringenin-chalcone synthase
VTPVFLNRVGTAVPAQDNHADFIEFGRGWLPDAHSRALFDRMVEMADITHRYAVLEPGPKPRDTVLDTENFFVRGAFPGTHARMQRFEHEARALALRAVAALAPDRDRITHLIVASCTGFTAPGLDFQLMQALELRPSIERQIVGFMGCFAAVNALRLARHIVRSEPRAQVLVVNIELCTLHLQEAWELEKMLSFLLFGDGCSAALVSAEPTGLELGAFRTAVVPRTDGMITWQIADTGFLMHLSGQVPGRIRRFLRNEGAAFLEPHTAGDIAHWAVHAGGRSILDAVQHGLQLLPDALAYSRGILRDYGNMSSATLMFVLDRILRAAAPPGDGMAMAFGPGLTVESFRFRPVG